MLIILILVVFSLDCSFDKWKCFALVQFYTAIHFPRHFTFNLIVNLNSEANMTFTSIVCTFCKIRAHNPVGGASEWLCIRNIREHRERPASPSWPNPIRLSPHIQTFYCCCRFQIVRAKPPWRGRVRNSVSLWGPHGFTRILPTVGGVGLKLRGIKISPRL